MQNMRSRHHRHNAYIVQSEEVKAWLRSVHVVPAKANFHFQGFHVADLAQFNLVLLPTPLARTQATLK